MASWGRNSPPIALTNAVVLGAGMGGLLAARTLADFSERVTVLERDALPPDVGHRRGVPQSKNFHALARRGCEVLDRMFPGLTDELIAAGAPAVRALEQMRIILSGQELARARTDAIAIQLTRPMLESAVRARVADIPNVKIVDNCAAEDLRIDGRVTGVHVPGNVLDADLVVDATGRAGRTRAWLAAQGYPPPAEEQVKVDIVYASRFLRLPEGALGADRLVLIGPIPGRTRGLALAAQEGDRWILTVFGMAGDEPPADEAELLDFIGTVAPPEVHAAVRDAEALTPLHPFRFPASVWRRYERLRRFPDGLLVFGDAICSFNPIYGQGMTVLALEAEALRRCLLAGGHNLAPRFFRSATKIVSAVWRVNTGADLTLPEVPGHRPLTTQVINNYVTRAQRVGGHDEKVATALLRIGGLADPPTAIFAPAVLARVLRRR